MLRTVMEYMELSRELKRLIQDNTADPNQELFEWVSTADKQLIVLKAKLEKKNVDRISMCSSDDDESPNSVENIKRLKELQYEKKRLLNDLSEQAGMRLTNNNPGIANLGDDNRPSKISERFSELYDNHWTDAMEALDGHKFQEKESIEVLLDVLKAIYEDCKLQREKRLKSFASLVLGIKLEKQVSEENIDIYQNVEMGKNGESKTAKKDDIRLQCSRFLSAKDINYTQDKHVKEAMYSLLNKKFVDKKRQDILTHKSLRQYIDQCFEVCWSICLQIPPVVIVTDVERADLFRSYTKSGDVIDHIVWPALLLHENGPVLYKGVAQMTSETRSGPTYENM
ncbi:uncharacterized protein LOC127714252 isoform X1 [Mytilus californianus]|uniref:uncharacterized protein LOC127714252 isoform X1 n=2 Tax=Mytilus californianus TaxID=6549 RepID=UPI0022486215|nr:uncharacterized protein LOC127714252 isoform X1 [Mytilus californianus]